MFCPSTIILPESRLWNLNNNFVIVDLPPPDGPMNATRSPGVIFKLKHLKTLTPSGYLNETSLNSISPFFTSRVLAFGSSWTSCGASKI